MKNLILLHANGYFPNCYDDILKGLDDQYIIHKFKAYPFISNGAIHSYDYFVQKLHAYIVFNKLENIHIVAHSFGTVLALKVLSIDPTLFEKMVLIEPVLIPHFKLVLASLLPLWVRKIFIKEINQALNRTDSWCDFDLAFKYFRGKKYFIHFSDDSLKRYLENILIKDGNVLKLAFNKESEAYCYSQVKSSWRELKKCRVPYLGLRGEFSNTVGDDSFKKWIEMANKNEIISIPKYAHLLPFEAPNIVNNYITKYLLDK